MVAEPAGRILHPGVHVGRQGLRPGDKAGDGRERRVVYDIWKHQQVNQPSIAGTTTFTQYISNRRTARPGSGTITTKTTSTRGLGWD